MVNLIVWMTLCYMGSDVLNDPWLLLTQYILSLTGFIFICLSLFWVNPKHEPIEAILSFSDTIIVNICSK